MTEICVEIVETQEEVSKNEETCKRSRNARLDKSLWTQAIF